ncbi:MAG: exodeoxyribonuclease VII small subunit [Candidatus Cloacimonetes bacterium]|jgi:exodeoxyribonuclease VII small subunit|nr:exodeoxyribonuclease VII small subunit [Candidatus Cloacimonadota bacterium]NLO43650.1 exodeoxyribonuclease VII small subunit [Candidatus Cloacimonadota bacterium]
MENANLKKLSFEKALKELETIVEKLSGSETSLDEMLELYSEGIKYLKQCQSKLSEAEAKIKILSDELPGKTEEM